MLKREVRGTRVHCEEAHHTTRKHQQALLCSLSVPLLLCALAVVFARCVRDESESHVLLHVPTTSVLCVFMLVTV